MSLTDQLRVALGEPEADSFQLMTEQLWMLTGEDLLSAGQTWEREHARVPQALRGQVEAEQLAWRADVQLWLSRHNRSLYTRVRGYMLLGVASDWEYPWPVAAILGICQVLSGLSQGRLLGLLGRVLQRVGVSIVERLADGSEDILRRTNRGIFADSVPTTLLGLRAHALRQRGRTDLAEALLLAPVPVLMDAHSRRVAVALYEGLGMTEPEQRFAALGALTREQFEREQRIFSWNLGGTLRGRRDRWVQGRVTALRSVPAPVVARGLFGSKRVVFKRYPLPEGFDIRDHDARVHEFCKAFVDPVTRDRDDYEVAVAYLQRRFGKLIRNS